MSAARAMENAMVVVLDEQQDGVPARDLRRPSGEIQEHGGWLTGHRIISLTAALGLLWPAYKAWPTIIAAPVPGGVTVGLTGATFVVACLIAAARTDSQLERLDRWLLLLGLLILVTWAASSVSFGSGYNTDEAAFVHGAASLLLHGQDPYGANLSSSLATFGVPPNLWTHTTSGGDVSTFGYPALPVLVTAPFVALLGSGQAVSIADVLLLVVATTCAFAVLPRAWRALAVLLCVAYPALGGLAVAGLTVVLMLPALIIVAHRWPRVGERGKLSSGDRLGAIAMGLMLATNQLAWFIAPFILVGIVMLRTARLGPRGACNVASRYGALAGATFLVVNAPFIVWSPMAWWNGIVGPIVQHAMPYGQGLVGLTMFLRIGGGDIDAYTYAAAALYVGLLLAFAAHFKTLARACLLLPVVALYASGRSLSEYWLVLAAPIVVSALAVDSASLRSAAQLTWLEHLRVRLPARIVLPALLAPAAAFLAIALLTPAPLSINILRAQLDQSRTAVARLWVDVHNSSDARLRPHFAINSTGEASAFWRIISGPSVLTPGADARYVLAATDLGPVTSGSGAFLLQAVTGSPTTMSSSSLFSPPLQYTW